MRGTRRRGRVLALAVLVGLAIWTSAIAMDVYVDVILLGEGTTFSDLSDPAELWEHALILFLCMLGSVSYARLLLSRDEVAAASLTYRALAESAHETILIIDTDRRIAYINSAGAREFGVDAQSVVGQRIDRLFEGEALEKMEADLKRAFRGEETYSEWEVPSSAGHVGWIGTRLVPMFGEGGEVLATLHDITATREEVARNKALSHLSEALHARLSFEAVLDSIVREAADALDAPCGMLLTQVDHVWVVADTFGYAEHVEGQLLSPREARIAAAANAAQYPLLIEDASRDERVDPETARRYGWHSLLAVPLLTQRGTFGLLLSRPEQRLGFSPDIVEIAARVGAIASHAVDNASLFEEKSTIADVLQTATLMLPDRLPGIEFSHVYRSATESARVGGDFYDLFRMGGNRIGVTIGDISGHGIGAAVLTSLIKNGIRVNATQEPKTPDEIVSRASSLLVENSSPHIFATIFFGVIDFRAGSLEYCSAGHPPGLVYSRHGGAVRHLSANSPIAGAFPQQDFATTSEHIGAGDILFLYTDGLTEARAGARMFGEERLLDVLTRAGDRTPAGVVEEVMSEVLSFTDGVLTDDVAVLAISLLANGS